MPPTKLIDSLEAVRRRAKLLSLAYGLGIVLSAAAGLLVATILADYLLNLRAIPRLVVMAAAAAAFAFAFFRWIVRPAMARLSLSDIAGRLERAFPQFDDRLRSSLDFLRPQSPATDGNSGEGGWGDGGWADGGSEVMKQRVVEQTTQLASTIDLRHAVVAKPAWYSFGGAAASLLLFALLAAMVGGQLRSIALDHLLDPFDSHPWPKRVEISADGTLPARVPVGQRLDVRMTLLRGDKPSIKPVVCYQYGNGPIEQEFMTRGANGVYDASLDARVEASESNGHLHVWMKAGDDRLDLPAVTVVPRLMIKSVEAVVAPPKYVTSTPPITVNLAAAPAVMAVGSDVALHVTFNKPLADRNAVTVVPLASDGATTQPAASSGEASSVAWSSDGGATAVGRFTASSPLRFHLHALDVDGFANNALEEYELIVRPDQSPSVQIENPRRNEERTAVATLPLQGLAEDDYGIQTLKLVVDRIERATDSHAPASVAPQTMLSHWEIPLVEHGAPTASVGWSRIEGTGDRLRYRANYAWDLSQLNAGLRGGDVLEYYLLVSDNFNLNGQTHPPVPSGKLRINIISQDELANRVIADLQAAKTQVEEAKRVQLRTGQETANLVEDTKAKPKLDEADHVAAERLTGQQSAVAGQTRQIAAKVEEIGQRLEENKSQQLDLKDLTRDVASDLNDAAQKPMKLAAQHLADAQQPKLADARNANLDQAKASQNEASDDLQRAMDRMGDIGSLQQTIARINDLLRQQREVGDQTQEAGKNNLGKMPDQMTTEDRQKLEAAADAQAKLADRTAKAVDAMKKAADQLSKTDPATAEAMAKAAETATQQQVAPNQQKAAEQARQNQQASAQSAQKQAELGLQMIVSDLEQAQQRKLAELSKQLEELQQQIANLIRRQAGHNLDNVTVQGPDALAKLGVAVAADLYQLAQRTPQSPAGLDPDRLAPSQEQTERNTRDISKATESLPNGAQPAAQLLRAADHMERAIVSLSDSKWADAYDPPQVEALAALQAAMKTVDQQKAKVDNQIAATQQEAVRQKYVGIKQDQEKLNAETARIKGARDAQGALKRADMIRLNQLPGEQGELSDRVAELDKALSDAGSIVYEWANKDIVQSMNQVKADLPLPDKATATQAQQVAIVDQLDEMIRNLATKPKESKFAAEGSGGGSGKGSAPAMPPEAELRLLKDLQRTINGNTKADALAQKNGQAPDKPQLLALGTREGELRGLLDQLLQNASKGELKLGPEPDPSRLLPEEAKQEDVENDELDKNLLDDKPAAEQEETQAGLVGDRMARSRQRLAINSDPGRVTQIIQDRILQDFDVLIDQSRKQEAEIRNPPKDSQSPQKQSRPGEQMAKADNQGNKPGSPKANPVANPAQVSAANAPGNAATDLSKEIKESLAEWGQVTPRLRDAQIEGSSETIIEQYRKLTEDYYRSLAAKATDH
jgi:hypothetical protein